jgi:hypothetical protein
MIGRLKLLSRFTRAQGGTSGGSPSKEAILGLIQEHSAKLRPEGALRKGWQVGAASWVKKKHIDRGDVKVGLHSTKGTFHVIESLRPRYVVPSLAGCALKPYVMHYDMKAAAHGAPAAAAAAPGAAGGGSSSTSTQ